MNANASWNWFVWGKHPGIPDFLFAGEKTPLFQQFTRWVDTGFSRVDAQLKTKSRHCSWRFWTRGAGEDVVCGLVRNSCDNYGRSFPLLWLGSGPLEGWTINRSLLPFAFESAWKHFEYLAAARCGSIPEINDALRLIPPPAPCWREYQQRIHDAPDLLTRESFEESIRDGGRLYKIDCSLPEQLPRDLCFCSSMVATSANKAPGAVFIGETGTRIAVAMIDNTLLPADFTWLWSIRPKSPQSSTA